VKEGGMTDFVGVAVGGSRRETEQSQDLGMLCFAAILALAMLAVPLVFMSSSDFDPGATALIAFPP
jgi:hypothetical protein